MYRNVSYFIDSDWQGHIRLDTWDNNGKPITKEFMHNSWLFYEEVGGEYKGLYGNPLKRVEFKSVAERKGWINKHPNITLYGCLNPVREFLISNFIGQQESPDFTKFPLRTQVLDIEVQVEDVFPEPKYAACPICVMTFYDSFLEEYHVWINQKNYTNTDTKEIKYHIFEKEKEMYDDWLKWYARNRPDIITGWNIESFDIPYLVNRLIKFYDEEKLFNLLSTNKRVTLQEVLHHGATNKVSAYKIEGTTVLDYFIFYKYRFGNPSMPDFKLNTIAEHELKIGKLHYEGSIKDFMRKDFAKFTEYNIQDVKLVVALDKKLKYIDLIRTVCTMGLCEYDSIHKTMPVILSLLVLEGLKQGKQIPTRAAEESDKGEYPGAFVFEPTPAVHRCGVSTFDLNSLYPNIMVCLNMSPETKVGRIIDESPIEYTVFRTRNNKILNIPKDKMAKLIKDSTISSNKVLYVNPLKQKGLIAKFLEELYDKRKECKKESHNYERKASKIRESIELLKDEIKKLEAE